MLISSIFADNPEMIRYIIVLILGVSLVTSIMKRLFKLAIFFGVIAIAGHFLYPLIQM